MSQNAQGMMRVTCSSCRRVVTLPAGVPRGAPVLCSCGAQLQVPQLPAALTQLLLQRGLGGAMAAPKGTPKYLVESLPVIKYSAPKSTSKSGEPPAGDKDGDEDNTRTCIICMDEYEVGSDLSMLPCFHKFHKECIAEWLSGSKTCPICNGDVPEMMGQSREFATDDD